MAPPFLDTNIFLYAISTDPAEAGKRDIALAALDRGGALSVQVLQEFYVQATRPARGGALSHDEAVGLVQAWLRFPVQETTLALMHDALALRAVHRLSYRDAAIVAAARALDCREILSEDLSHGQRIGGVTIRNPFR
ncbi:MAG: tRNA(fMet)-specific endonuclease VapC [Pseudorhodoplanes sp.]|nr:tRNA(fMet)-specific endonuclease VapC [Pseudorhodoplanes sp.]